MSTCFSLTLEYGKLTLMCDAFKTFVKRICEQTYCVV